ncbi:hypothetical protein BGX24_005120 [Mortierella sp. AD032]|nr:hypothetical protein BGX24_005120 [Mortierella sp. AD032]
MPSTKLSPFAISTLPEPVAKLFGGTSIYSLIPPPNTNTTTKDASTTSVSGATEVETESSTEIPTPAAKIPTKNTAGCQWVPVKRGDRVAVMMGTSKDFLLFPSFQRLLFRHLSREDFEDRVARANRIPCPATAIVVTNTTSGGGEAVQQQMREQGERIRQEVLQRQMLHQRQREERDVSAMEEGDRSVTATAATNTGRGRTWIEWMSPRRRQNNEHRSNSDPTTRTVNTATIGAELGIRLPIPPSSESTTAFVDGSSASNNSSSSSSIGGSSDRSGRSFGEEEDSMRGQAEDEKYSSRADDLGSTPNNNNNVDMMDEKSVAAALDSTLATTNNPSIPTNAVHKATTNDKETREEREQRWLVLEERFLREDYDSSEYSYASSSEDEYDELPLDYDGPYYSSEDSESSDGDDGSDAEDEEDELPGRRRRSSDRDHAATTATARWRWGIRDWIYFFTFCTPHPRTLTATNSNETTGTNRGLASSLAEHAAVASGENTGNASKTVNGNKNLQPSTGTFPP